MTENLINFYLIFTHLFLLLQYLFDFARREKEVAPWRKWVGLMYLAGFTVALVLLIESHRFTFFTTVSDILFFIAWLMIAIQVILEFYFGKSEPGFPILSLSFIVLIFSFILSGQSRESPSEYRGYLYFLFITFYLFGQVCSLLVFLLSAIYTVSISFFKSKRFEMLSNRVPPLALQYGQVNLFLRLSVLCLSMGILMGILWKISLGEADFIWWVKMAFSLIGCSLFAWLLFLRLAKGLSYVWSIWISSLGYLFLVVSLFMGQQI